MSYESDFQNAIRFSKEIGFEIPSIETTNKKYLDNPKIQASLHNVMIDILGTPPEIDNLSSKCVGIHAALINKVANIIGSEPILTFGCVTSDNGDKWFSVSENEISRWLSTGVESPHSLKLHAWLTLPSMEIVDFTFLPTYAHVQYMKDADRSSDNLEFGVIAKHPDNLTGMVFKPVAIGNDMPEKLHFPSITISQFLI
ncbi:hypothetical protein HF670_11990 [Acidithiobacillus thiooxidans]|uniref:hypothetical protein n=1 Tax=Acidithiobacillus thiooxidans TaxID=930 RepID=UPI001C0717DA|nr:hypothetical protein [Acidithiobacillus thiooxidans]MBU2840267.1 hypothetical protein [Acidithiobacillus thiooxidans]MBU2844095.1 hypothetical protein [Acidithiobacillus thiooxidans]